MVGGRHGCIRGRMPLHGIGYPQTDNCVKKIDGIMVQQFRKLDAFPDIFDAMEMAGNISPGSGQTTPRPTTPKTDHIEISYNIILLVHWY